MINISDSHWICACVARKMESIFILDSMNANNTDVSIEINSYIRKQFGLKKFATVYLKSTDQVDNYNCGLFTIVNASIFLLSIVTEMFAKNGPKWCCKSETITMEEKKRMRNQLLNIFHGVDQVDVLLQWIGRKK